MSKRIITNKQNTILTLLLTFRFLNSKQIQEFLNHKDHRRINSWLKDLVEKEYIERDFKPVFGILTKPATFFLTAKGRAYLKSSYKYHFPKYLRRISRDNKVSKAFRIRCQIVADWYLMLFANNGKDKKGQSITDMCIVDNLIRELTTDTKEEKIPLNTLQFFTPSYYPKFVLLKPMKPDAYLRKKTTKGIAHGLLFVLDAYIPRFLLRYALKRIFDTLDEESWEDESVHELHVYFLCPNNMIITYCRRLLPSFLEKYYGSKPVEILFATRNQLYRKKQNKDEKIKWVIFSSTNY